MKTPSPSNRRPPPLGPVAGAALAALVLSACEKERAVSPDRVVMVAGNNQAGYPGETLKEPLVVRILGPRQRDFLGRQGTRLPAAGVTVRFELEDLEEHLRSVPSARPQDGLPTHPSLFAESGAEPGADPGRVEVTTDASGLARAWVRLGTYNGDWRVEAIIERPDTRKTIKEHFRLVCGVRKIVQRREANVGEEVPLGLRLVTWDGAGRPPRPLEDRMVYFRVVGEPHGTVESAEIQNRRARTDDQGVRNGTEVVLGDRPGLYHVLAEVEPRVAEGAEVRGLRPESGADGPGAGEAATGSPVVLRDKPLRGILYRIVAMDWYVVGLKVVGGCLLFLLGVRFLSSGLLLIVSPSLQLHSGPWTSNRLLGYLGGGVTGLVFQSWSTVASHLVSFANGGLLTARGGTLLLIGASLGATALPQFLSLELAFLTIPFLALGLLGILLPRRRNTNSWGWVLIGAGLVLASWSLLTEGVELLSLSEALRRDILPGNVDYSQGFLQWSGDLLQLLLLGLAVGFLLRTSNLLVVLGILLASRTVTTTPTVVPLIVGANLGSALLLLVRSAFKSREARRLAMVGVVFHSGTALLVTVLSLVPVGGASAFLWLVDTTAPGRLFHPVPENVGQHIAMVHTLYNLLGGLVALGFPRLLAFATDRVLPPGRADEPAKPHQLDANLIPVPSLALRQVRQEVIYLAELGQKTVAEAFDAFRYGDVKLGDQVVRRGETMANLHRDVSRYLILVSENPLSREDACDLEKLQSAAGSLVRIADCAERLQELAGRRVEEAIGPSDDMDRELGDVYDLVVGQFDNLATLLRHRDPRIQESVAKIVERLAKTRTRLETQWLQKIEERETDRGASSGTYLQALVYQEAFDLLFRVAGHLSHISQRMRVLVPENV